MFFNSPYPHSFSLWNPPRPPDVSGGHSLRTEFSDVVGSRRIEGVMEGSHCAGERQPSLALFCLLLALLCPRELVILSSGSEVWTVSRILSLGVSIRGALGLLWCLHTSFPWRPQLLTASTQSMLNVLLPHLFTMQIWSELFSASRTYRKLDSRGHSSKQLQQVSA